MERKEAIEIVRKLYNESLFLKKDKEAIVTLIPEIKENEDDKIKKGLIQYFNKFSLDTFAGLDPKKILAWLEKQGENSVRWNENTDGNKPQKHHSVLMKTAHGIVEGEWNGNKSWIQYRWASSIKDSDVLFWIELSDVEKQGEQNSVWSEEDEKMLQGIWDEIIANKHDAKEYEWKTYDKFLNWLKSLKERVLPQPEQEWSQEDKKMFDEVINNLHNYIFKSDNTYSYIDCDKHITWLKSLRPQNTWKPSDEQIYWLKWAIDRMPDTEKANEAEAVLEDLLEQLKKLEN